MAADSDVRDPIDILRSSLQSVCDQLKDKETPCKDVDNFNLEEFWTKMAKVTRALRHEATKFSMAFSKLPAPTPVEKTGLVADLEKACLALLAAFSELPLSQGLTLRGEVSGFVWEVLRAVQGMLSAVGTSSSAGLQPVGTCWEKCDAIQRLSRGASPPAAPCLPSPVLPVCCLTVHLIGAE